MATMSSGKAREADRSIGAILVNSGRLALADVERIINFQKEHELRFGDAGMQLGLLSEADIFYALSLQFDYPYLSGPGHPVSDEVVVAYRPFSPEGERLRSLRSQLQLRWFKEGTSRAALAVVGTRPGEGRSLLAANLAVTFAQAKERTLLIDGDLRNPRQNLLFKIENQTGLSNLLTGRTQDQVIKLVPGIPGLAVLPSGPIPPNPEELLGRSSFDRILEQSMSAFDVVIIDTPAMTTGADVTLLARFAGAALVVARNNMTRTSEFQELVDLMQDAGVKVVGSVLVDAPFVKDKKSGSRS
ncbi:chain length determinant protein tyrosine kinase EpsG [Piscinibacter sp. HJYY11]|uniref:chain length determinant protein tyrosine kinase EpsG n=1 Tax=Piscinibacter sp. HJYY11 TaxID=2801333 RepID=UPI00191F0CAF|nr:chain length determinant protein tyrosine kinase EpsG [Piscinibacter sp. HJYY11]MBL0730298.1 chain length determinant protein tyrosine kinase EpsG [Piscinibacter sp. HJYY11]